jgi:hypothetical protein
MMLYLALPSYHPGDGYGSSAYYQSCFRDIWLWLRINPNFSRSVGYVDEGWQKKCRQQFPKLPEEIRQSIKLCVPAIRSQTAFVCKYMKSKYQW